MSLFERAKDQDNVLDGTIFAFEVHPGEGAYVTIAGRDDQVYIVAFNAEDFGYLLEMHRGVNAATR